MNTTLLALPGAENLAQTLASLLRCAASTLEVHRFPDGESLVRLRTGVAGQRVVLAAHLDHPDATTLPLLFAADAARDLGAAEVGLVAPYLPYLRQDERFRPGEAVTSRTYARMLSGAVDFLVTVDPHLHRFASLDEIYTVRSRVVTAAPAIAQWLARVHQCEQVVLAVDGANAPAIRMYAAAGFSQWDQKSVWLRALR